MPGHALKYLVSMSLKKVSALINFSLENSDWVELQFHSVEFLFHDRSPQNDFTESAN